jgi:hypothetical protein
VAKLDTAVQAHRAALAGLESAKEAAVASVLKARERVAPTRTALAQAIVEATVAGMRQNEIVKITGYSHEQVRTIVRAAGIEAD